MLNPLQVVDILVPSQSASDELLHAALSQGFLFVEGHGFTQAEVDALFQLSQDYFLLPESEKAKFPIDESNGGYTNFGGENLDPEKQSAGDPKEGFNFSNIDLNTGVPFHQPVPPFFQLEAHAAIVRSVTVKLGQVAQRVLEMLCIGLKVEDTVENGKTVAGKDWFRSRHLPDQESGTTFRLLHYPLLKSLRPEAVIRAGAHTDYGGITLLFQREGQEGLEILSPVTKKWEAVPFVGPLPEYAAQQAAPPIVVNIADLLSYWTGGVLKLTVHRVKFPPAAQLTGQDRYLIVFFLHPSHDALLEPVPLPTVQQVTTRGANAALTVLTAGQHLRNRLAATYGF